MSRHINVSNLAVWLIAFAVSVLSGYGCESGDPSGETGVGYIRPIVTVSPDISISDKAGEMLRLPDLPDPSGFHLVLQELNTGRVAEWDSVAAFDAMSLYRVGPYRLTALYGNAFAEGFDSPFFLGTCEFELTDGAGVEARIETTIENSVFDAEFSSDIASSFARFSLLFNSEGSGYFAYPCSESRPLYLLPGKINVYFDMTLADGRHACVKATTIEKALVRSYYHANVSLIGDGNTPIGRRIMISFDEKSLSDDVEVQLTDALFDQTAPIISAEGFSPGSSLELTEGSTITSPIAVDVSSASGLESLTLGVQCYSLLADGWSREIDLLHLDSAMASLVAEYGLTIERPSPTEARVDFSGMLPRLRRSANGSRIAFNLIARGSGGQFSEPTTLAVDLLPVNLRILSAGNPVVGVDRAWLRLNVGATDLRRNLVIEAADGETGHWEALAIDAVTAVSDTVSDVSFKVAPGIDDISLRLIYCGEHQSKLTMRRVSPEFSIAVDPYAQGVRVRLFPTDPDLLTVVTRLVMAFDSDGRLPITIRDIDRGEIYVTGLNPSTTYRMACSLLPAPRGADYSNWELFTTEAAAQLPNGDFEETRTTIDYKDMPSGGRYSQNMVEIFNYQNHVSWKENTPRRWANTNAKTFCRDAMHHNTWYMQPSCVTLTTENAFSQSFAVELRSVAWDIEGEEIADYLQANPPFTNYSRNVPHISWRAAGKLFLGSYSFDPLTMEEVYDEGIAFRSRPSSLNGYYRFLPCEDMPTDRGLVTVEVVSDRTDGTAVTIASGRVELPLSAGYKAFTVPLTYDGHFGEKATRIKVMFSSSMTVGTILEESAGIVTTPDPVTSASVGGRLSLDNITLSY